MIDNLPNDGVYSIEIDHYNHLNEITGISLKYQGQTVAWGKQDEKNDANSWVACVDRDWTQDLGEESDVYLVGRNLSMHAAIDTLWEHRHFAYIPEALASGPSPIRYFTAD